MKFFYFLFSAVVCLAILDACSKTGGPGIDNPDLIDQNDDIFPVVTVIKPTNNQVYKSGDSVVVQGYATDNKIVYKGSVKITDDANGMEVKSGTYESHYLQRMDFYVAFKSVVTAITNYTVTIEFQDHGANTVNQILKVKVNP
jgi:hypothetical protein